MRLSTPIYLLKRNAKRVAREQNISHSAALDKVANNAGFSNWSLLSKAHNKRSNAEKVLGRLTCGDMVILGARPGHGKTTFAMELVVAAAKQGRQACVYSLEETERLIEGRLAELGMPDVHEAQINISDSDAICASMICEELTACPHNTIAVIDYLQIMDQSRQKPELSYQLTELQQFAQNSGCIFIFIAQIDRTFNATNSPLPSMQDLRTPNPIDTQIFSKACFLHDGQFEMTSLT